jgi:hypothetical protein
VALPLVGNRDADLDAVQGLDKADVANEAAAPGYRHEPLFVHVIGSAEGL